MITWMQRHKKYLIITIWISTIAFVGAGFVGWGQYSYGDKAGAVAKVGDEEITMGDLQKAYSRLYSQYSQVFQGNFDEEKAKAFGLQKQALQQLIDKALIINLARSYDLSVSDVEVLEEIKSSQYFQKEGVFDKETYRELLTRNNYTMKEYEEDIRKDLLVRKVLTLLNAQPNAAEASILSTIDRIADTIEYKLLSKKDIHIALDDEKIKAYWETRRQNFMSEVSYDIRYIEHTKVDLSNDAAAIEAYYNENKNQFKDAEGKIAQLDAAKTDVIKALNDKATKDAALREYIAFKKGELKERTPQSITISESNNPFDQETIESIAKLAPTSPFLKPSQSINGNYYTIELVKTNPSTVKSYEDAKAQVVPNYLQEEQERLLLELANGSFATFKGKVADMVTNKDANKLSDLTLVQANEFLMELFTKGQKRGFVTLSSGDIVLYNILEQKLLTPSQDDQVANIANIKSAMFKQGALKELQNKFETKIFIEGL